MKGPDADIIELTHIESATVRKIIDYMFYHSKVPARTVEKPLPSTNLKDLLEDFDAKFVETDQDTMFKVLLVSHHRRWSSSWV